MHIMLKYTSGLKSTGTMWVDSVNFSYTRKNFSIEERMMTYADTVSKIAAEIIIPTPKKMERQELVAFFRTH